MFILLNWVKFYTKEMAKALKITLFGTAIILTIIAIKYKPVYEVTVDGTLLGYVENKEKLELKVKKYMEDTTGNIAFKEQTVNPDYELKFVSRNNESQDKEVLLAIEDSTIITYKVYAVTIDGEVQTTISTEEEAKELVNEMQNEVDENIELNVGIVEQYTTDFEVQSEEEASQILNTIKVAKVEEYNAEKAAEEEKQKAATASSLEVTSVGTIAGISLSRPVAGTISSRFGSRSSIRSSAHTGTDIATALGTPITPIAGGTVTYAAEKGSYGNLVIIDHGNGVESYYAHCNEIYVVVGQTVESNTVIATVGSTGNSTGPHLHLEIRQNGTILNPEDYLY